MRTVKEIYNSIVTAKDADDTIKSLLPAATADSWEGLLFEIRNNPGKITVWRSMAAIWAIAVWSFELILDLFKSDVLELEKETRFGHAAWWNARVLEFQMGHSIVVEAGKPIYQTVDETARVVKFVAVQEAGGEVLIKVAKGSTAQPVVMASSELDALNSYVKKLAPMGVPVRAMSSAADLLKAEFDVYYDAIYGKSNVVAAVEEAINTYLVTLNFKGEFYVEKLIDAIQKVPGVVSVHRKNIEINDGVLGYRQISRIYATRSGYLRVDPAFPLSATINYQA